MSLRWRLALALAAILGIMLFNQQGYAAATETASELASTWRIAR